jgi:AcrR family transcriptional regulator
MQGAGLTHGGFYSYFESKSDLYAEAMSCFFTVSANELLHLPLKRKTQSLVGAPRIYAGEGALQCSGK